jgi:hypothetical protein
VILKSNIDYKKLAEAFNRVPLVAGKQLRLALHTSFKAVQIDAKRNHRFKSKSNHLENSVSFEVAPAGLEAKVFLDEGVAKYGKYVHDGTDPHVIRPKGGALSFVMGGKKFLVPKHARGEGGYLTEYWRKARDAGAVIVPKGYVNHPGTKPDKFLYQAAARNELTIVARINATVARIFKIAGLNVEEKMT